MSDKEIEAALRRIESHLRRLSRRTRSEATPCLALTVEDAGTAISRSKSKMWDLIRKGIIRTKVIDQTTMVPMSELLRITSLPSTPQEPPVVIRHSIAAEQEKIRVALKKKR